MTSARAIEIPSLDGLRTVSIAFVFVAHAGLDKVVPGGFGVTVFFVLSGYLITTLLRLELDRSERISAGDFYIRRVFRILPVFYVVLTATLVSTWVFGLGTGHVNSGATLAQFGHITNYWAVFNPASRFMDGTGVYWSLAVEEHFYLIFPVFFIILNKRGMTQRSQGSLLVLLAAVVLAWRLYLVFVQKVSIDRTYLATDTRIDSLLIGCALAVRCNPVLDPPPKDKTLNIASCAAVVALLATFAIRNDSFRETFRYSIQSVAIAVIITYVVRKPRSLAGSILNTRPMVRLGRLSYSFYLVHFVVLLQLQRSVHDLPAAIIALAISILLAMALERFVEQPSHKIRNKVLLRRRGRRAANPVTPATT